MVASETVTWLTRPVALLLGEGVELHGAADGRLHLVRVVEETVVHLVLAGLLLEGDQVLEAVAPQDLAGQVRRPRLRRHPRRLDHACQQARRSEGMEVSGAGTWDVN